MIGAVAQRLIARLVRRRVSFFIAILVLLGVGAFFVTRALNPGGAADLRVPLLASGEPEAINAFLRGNRSYDADLVWNAYSDEAKERLRGRGSGPDDLRRQLTVARERGNKIEDAAYVGSYQLPSGSSMYFYVVRVSNQQSQGQRDFVPYVFTLDGSGKISRVQ